MGSTTIVNLLALLVTKMTIIAIRATLKTMPLKKVSAATAVQVHIAASVTTTVIAIMRTTVMMFPSSLKKVNNAPIYSIRPLEHYFQVVLQVLNAR